MTITLSKPMETMLRQAPNYWRKCSPSPTITALEKRGLVELRDAPGESGTMAGFEWQITDAGREIDGREPEPTYNVDVWNHEGDVVKHFRDVTADEVDEIRERYSDEPLDVVAHEAR